MNTKKIGVKGEQEAIAFLKAKGYEILASNYRYKRCEIDLIVKQNNLLVFVEVKKRKNNRFGNPEDFVSNAQQNRIQQASEEYIATINWQGRIRFDIVAINGKEIFHIEDGF